MLLFCLTFAGGSASFFNGLGAYVCPETELVKMEYAGHTERWNEAFYADFDELVSDMYGRIKEQVVTGRPYALLGYSMGAIAAAEVTKMILARGELLPPQHVFLLSHTPCAPEKRYDPKDADADEVIRQWTIQFGGLPEKLIKSDVFWRTYLPIYRADFKLIVFYDYSRLEFMTDVPATVMYSPEDLPYMDMKKWHGVFAGKFDILEFDGGHFFLRDHAREVADVVNERLRNYDV